jgi:MFS family permease
MAFFVGILPALVVFWIRRGVPESEMWQERHRAGLGGGDGKRNSASYVSTTDARVAEAGFVRIFRPPYGKHTFALLFMNFFGMFAWWGLFTWIPPYLSLPVDQGGRGFGVMGTTTLLVVLNLVGMFPGYASFGWVADALGRRRSFILYTFMAALLVPLYAMAREPWVLMVAGALLAFFGTGFFSGSGIIGSEIFPTAVRARALGFTYNGARTMSSIAPFVIGRVAQTRGLSWAFYLCGVSFLLSCAVATQLPETKGKQLE